MCFLTAAIGHYPEEIQIDQSVTFRGQLVMCVASPRSYMDNVPLYIGGRVNTRYIRGVSFDKSIPIHPSTQDKWDVTTT